MFGGLTDKFQSLFTSFGKEKKITEKNISDAAREVRLALLEADVSYSVASLFVKRVKEKALGETVLKSLKPKEQFVKIIHDELVLLMGDSEKSLDLQKGKLSTIMLCGLQGSGKTTTVVKLANYLKQKKNKKVLVAACDLQRPAAVEQLKTLAKGCEIDVFSIDDEKSPKKVAKKAKEKAIDEKYQVLLIDTAGRLHIDESLMQELDDVKKCIEPTDVLFVASAATGQDSVKIAADFNDKIGVSGNVLTMLDGSARAGAAISIVEVTKKPLLFEGIGEKIDDFQVFNPESMADRILGMGDIINLTRKAEDHISEEESKKMEKKLKKASFTYSDYLKQMKMIQKMGSMKSIMKMMPGMSALGDLDLSSKEMKKTEAIILSMTLEERNEEKELSYTRKKRIASGAGVDLSDVNKLAKGFKRIKQLMKKMLGSQKNKKGFFNKLPNMNDIKDQFGGKIWR